MNISAPFVRRPVATTLRTRPPLFTKLPAASNAVPACRMVVSGGSSEAGGRPMTSPLVNGPG